MIQDALSRRLIAAALGAVADEICRDHYDTLTQEPALSARIGQGLETKLNGVMVFGHRLRILSQDIPDRGAGAMERRIGADLYIGIDIDTEQGRITKGLLVQSKWDSSLTTRTSAELNRACDNMLAVSDASYVWIYSASGVRVIDARKVRTRKKILGKLSGGEGLDDFFDDALACVKGDFQMGLPDEIDTRQALRGKLKELSVPTGLIVNIKNPSGVFR
ncbi:hypothetical protein [Methylobacterium sp. WL116]|uniref:hypothetical protein n=1 Tax=Methylobacterium sp. WL116 TaxID=2603889 RepID=UPI0011CAA3B5|nr:hypothetical protein [Methylobacterium sp. WL116]TXM93092.1 hypothetical protein FV223_09500 [Methylobacterium sp. WL116]